MTVLLHHPVPPALRPRNPISQARLWLPGWVAIGRHLQETGAQRERSGDSPRSLPRTPAGSHVPSEAPAPTGAPSLRHLPAAQPPGPQPLLSSAHLGGGSSLVAHLCVPPPVPCPQASAESRPAPTTACGMVTRCSRWGTYNKLQGALMRLSCGHTLGSRDQGIFISPKRWVTEVRQIALFTEEDRPARDSCCKWPRW